VHAHVPPLPAHPATAAMPSPPPRLPPAALPTPAPPAAAPAATAPAAVATRCSHDELGAWLSAVVPRMTQLTPDWPHELRLATVEAMLLEQQQQQQLGSRDGAAAAAGWSGRTSGLLAARLGHR
jgi:hypothetical protein